MVHVLATPLLIQLPSAWAPGLRSSWLLASEKPALPVEATWRVNQ